MTSSFLRYISSLLFALFSCVFVYLLRPGLPDMSTTGVGLLRSSNLCQPCVSHLEASLMRNKEGQTLTCSQLLNPVCCPLCLLLEDQLFPKQTDSSSPEGVLKLRWYSSRDPEGFAILQIGRDHIKLGDSVHLALERENFWQLQRRHLG